MFLTPAPVRSRNAATATMTAPSNRMQRPSRMEQGQSAPVRPTPGQEEEEMSMQCPKPSEHPTQVLHKMLQTPVKASHATALPHTISMNRYPTQPQEQPLAAQPASVQGDPSFYSYQLPTPYPHNNTIYMQNTSTNNISQAHEAQMSQLNTSIRSFAAADNVQNSIMNPSHPNQQLPVQQLHIPVTLSPQSKVNMWQTEKKRPLVRSRPKQERRTPAVARMVVPDENWFSDHHQDDGYTPYVYKGSLSRHVGKAENRVYESSFVNFEDDDDDNKQSSSIGSTRKKSYNHTQKPATRSHRTTISSHKILEKIQNDASLSDMSHQQKGALKTQETQRRQDRQSMDEKELERKEVEVYEQARKDRHKRFEIDSREMDVTYKERAQEQEQRQQKQQVDKQEREEQVLQQQQQQLHQQNHNNNNNSSNIQQPVRMNTIITSSTPSKLPSTTSTDLPSLPNATITDVHSPIMKPCSTWQSRLNSLQTMLSPNPSESSPLPPSPTLSPLFRKRVSLLSRINAILE